MAELKPRAADTLLWVPCVSQVSLLLFVAGERLTLRALLRGVVLAAARLL